MLSFSFNELKQMPDLEETVICKECGLEHEVLYGQEEKPDGTKIPSKKLAFMKCSEQDKLYLIGIDGKYIWGGKKHGE